MNVELSQSLVYELGWTLVHFLWEGLVIAVLLAAGLRIFRRSPAQYKYLAGCAALALMAIAPPATLDIMIHLNKSLPAISFPATSAWTESTGRVATTLPPRIVTAVPDVSAAGFAQRLEMLFPWLVLGWVAGVCALSCRLFAGWWQIRRLRRTAAQTLPWTEALVALARRLGVSRPVRLLQSALVEVPTVIGWLRPVILLPASCVTGLTPAQLESIIAHELAHIRRHDYLINLLQSAVETLLFYHPAVWWVSRRVREERELCCDDLAVVVCGDRLGYARALATLEELRPASAQLALAAGGAPLLQRIRRLAGQPERSPGRASWPVAGIALLLVLGILAAGMREHRAVAAATPPEVGEAAGTQEPGARTNSLEHIDASYNGKGRRAIVSKLGRIRIGAVNYANLPLEAVLKDLTKTALAHDPEGKGVNFYFEQQVPVSPATNTDMSALPVDGQPDISPVKVNLTLQDATLADVLHGITKAADHPIKYSVLDYAVLFSMKDPNEPPPLEMHTFHVDSPVFIQRLESAAGVLADTGGNGVESGSNSPTVVAEAIRKYFAARGLDLSTNVGRVVVFNDRKGFLTVRATAAELELVEKEVIILNDVPPGRMPDNAETVTTNEEHVARLIQDGKFLYEFGRYDEAEAKFKQALAIDPANLPAFQYLRLIAKHHDRVPAVKKGDVALSTNSAGGTSAANSTTNPPLPEVNIKAKFVQITSSPGDTNVIFDVAAFGGSPSVTGLLSEPQFETTIKALEQRRGAEILASPQIVTESGRQARMQIGNTQPFLTSPKGTNAFYLTNVFIGETLDALATVSADRKSIQMKLIPSVSQLSGYEPAKTTNASRTVFTMGMPRFSLRQTTANVTIWDDQTVVIGGLITDSTNTMVQKVPLLGSLPIVGGLFRSKTSQPVRTELLIFVTVTLINPDGTLYHSDEERTKLLTGSPPLTQTSTNR